MPLFFAIPTETPETWTISLTKDDEPQQFDLNNVSYERFCGITPTFTLANDSEEIIETIDITEIGPGSFSITENNTSISNFTITSDQDGATQCTDFGNIVVTPVVTLVSSIIIQGEGDVSTITTPAGTLQMEATVLPLDAEDATYAWSVADGSGSASIDALGLLTAITDGTVIVTATANDASEETGSTTITISNQTASLNEANWNDINIYPSPVKNKLLIEVEIGQINGVKIYDFSGKEVISISNNNSKSIDVSSLNQGAYILKIQTNNGIVTSKFIKE